MGRRVPIIETKLIPPMIKKNWIRRPTLMKKLQMMTKYPLTLLNSGAGYGKSASLSLFAHDFQLNVCWYTITANDDDMIPYISHIVHSIRKRYHSFGDELLAYIRSMDGYIREPEIQMLSSLFIKDLGKLRENVILVFDDYHLVDHSFPINQWMETVIEHLPAGIHIIVSSRVKPKWGLITKWKVTGKLLEINEEHFKVSQEEAELLFRDFYHLPLKGEEINAIYKLTEGWIIALSLIAEQLYNGAELSSILNDYHASMTDLFNYLAGEVFSKQSAIIQSFIEQVAVLEEITPVLCDNILGIQGSKAILEQLVDQNAFIYQLNGTNQYRFHSLFKTAMERKIKQENPSLYKEIHEKSARYYEKHRLWEQALLHYEKIQSAESVAALLEKHAPTLLDNGKLEYLADRMKRLPVETKDRYPSLWFYEGEVQRYLSFYERAKKSYQHAIELADLDKDWELAGKAYEGIAAIYIDTIQPGIAERYLSAAIGILEKHLGKKHPAVQNLYGSMVENLVNSGQVKKAEALIRNGTFNLDGSEKNNLDARMYLRTGRLQKAQTLLSGRLAETPPSLPQTHRETEVLLSYIEACLGNGKQAKKLAQKGIEQGIKYKNPFVEAVGWMRLGHASQLIDDTHFQLAEQCYLTSLDIMEKIRVPRGKAEPYMGLCLLYSKNNEFERSQEMGKLALFETEKVNDLWLSSFISLALGISALNCQKMDDVETYLSQAERDFRQCKDPFGYTLTRLWFSFYYFQRGNWQAFKQSMTDCLQEVQLGTYDFLFMKRTSFGPMDLQSFIPLLLKAKEMGIHTSYTHRLLQQSGYDQLDSHPGYTLKVNTFGKFQVYLGNRRVSDKDWQRMKAKELFQFLLVHKNRWWSKEEIYGQLWPNAKERNMDKEFKVIFNSCNKALEPERKARSNPFYLLRGQHGYRINPKAVMEIDFEQFEQWLNEGLRERTVEKAITILLKGLELYKGPFMADAQDETTFAPLREHFQTLFLRGAEKLAQLYVQTNQTERAIHWCDQILAVDKTWEEAYRLLMYCHYQKNNRPLAIKYYKRLCRILKEEYGVEPMDTTVQMYEMILEAGEIGM